MKKNIIHSLFAAMFGLTLLSCNAAQNGFHAPDGSEVSYLTEAIDLKFAGSGEILQLATVKVTVDTGVGDGSAGAEGNSSANNIQGVISCVYCNLYIFKEGVTTYLPQTSLVDAVAAKSFAFETNEQGTYTFVIGVVSPLDLGFVDSDGELLSYTDNVIADIGVSQVALSVSGGPAG